MCICAEIAVRNFLIPWLWLWHFAMHTATHTRARTLECMLAVPLQYGRCIFVFYELQSSCYWWLAYSRLLPPRAIKIKETERRPRDRAARATVDAQVRMGCRSDGDVVCTLVPTGILRWSAVTRFSHVFLWISRKSVARLSIADLCFHCTFVWLFHVNFCAPHQTDRFAQINAILSPTHIRTKSRTHAHTKCVELGIESNERMDRRVPNSDGNRSRASNYASWTAKLNESLLTAHLMHSISCAYIEWTGHDTFRNYDENATNELSMLRYCQPMGKKSKAEIQVAVFFFSTRSIQSVGMCVCSG